MADWKKILFEGAEIEVNSITASNLPTTLSADVPVLTINSDGKFAKIDQTGLSVQQGNTNFTIAGEDGTSVTHDASSDTLKVLTSNTSYVRTDLTTEADGARTIITFAPNSDDNPFITGSSQLNIINGNATDFSNGTLGGDWDTAIQPISGAIIANRSASKFFDGGVGTGFASNYYIVSPNNAYSSWNSAGDSIAAWRATANLWANHHTDAGTSLTPQPNPTIYGKLSVYWLSASFAGGFSDGTISLSESFSSFTQSIEPTVGSGGISQSLATLILSQSSLNAMTSSLAASAGTSSFLLLDNFVPKQIASIAAATDVNQVTLQGNSPQGRQIRLGTPSEAGNPNSAHNLTIEGVFNANTLALNSEGVLFQQQNVALVNGSTTYGIHSTHSHDYHGQVFVTGALFDVDGPVTMPGLVAENGVVQVLVSDNGTIKRQFISNGGANTLMSTIASSSFAVSESFAQIIQTITGAMAQGITDAGNIDLLQAGYSTNADSLEITYEQGIFFGTGSTVASANAGNVFGGTNAERSLGETASFSASQDSGTATMLTSTLTSASNESFDTSITYNFDSDAFVTNTGIFTGSGELSASLIGIYGAHTDGILTASNTTENLDYIAQLASTLVGSFAITRFLTGSGQFADLENAGDLVNIAQPGTPQGVLEFLSGSNYKFGATASKLHTGGEPTFANLTVGDDSDPDNPQGVLQVNGTLTRIDITNLNIKDQFILINSGALQDGLSDNANDNDGGILVGQGGESGSLFMYDNSTNSWGIRGARQSVPNTRVAADAISDSEGGIVPEVTVRAIKYADGAPPSDIDTVIYGYESVGVSTKAGLMYIDTSEGSENVYIYA